MIVHGTNWGDGHFGFTGPAPARLADYCCAAAWGASDVLALMESVTASASLIFSMCLDGGASASIPFVFGVLGEENHLVLFRN